jgi:hypothetical protein
MGGGGIGGGGDLVGKATLGRLARRKARLGPAQGGDQDAAQKDRQKDADRRRGIVRRALG